MSVRTLNRPTKKRKANLIPCQPGRGDFLFYLSLRSKTAKQFPDCWSFWGGGIEEGESPEGAMLREIREELLFTPQQYKYLGIYYDAAPNEKHIFYCSVDSGFEGQIRIQESQGGKWFDMEEIETEPKMMEEDREVIRELVCVLRSQRTVVQRREDA